MRALLASTAIAIALFAGCGGGGGPETIEIPELPPEPREVRISINRPVGPEHAGLLMAEANGYFRDVGLEVVLDPGSSPMWPIRYLLSKLVDSDFSISHEPQVAMAVEHGLPLTAIRSLISKPTAALIWLKGSGIKEVSDLRGKTIAIPGLPFQRGFLEAMLQRSGMKLEDVKLRYIGYRAVPALIRGGADAIFADAPQLEGVELRSLGRTPVIVPFHRIGTPPYEELVLIATTGLVSREPPWVRDFMAALSRGTAAAMRNPQAVVREIENHIEPSLISSRKAREKQVERVLPLLSRDGYMDPEQAENLVAWMHGEGMLAGTPSASSLVTNKFLPEDED